jgi:hypothetical protein
MGLDTSQECAVRDRLLNDLTDAAQAFALRAEELRLRNTNMDAIRDALERARTRAEEAHALYFAHREEHGC